MVGTPLCDVVGCCTPLSGIMVRNWTCLLGRHEDANVPFWASRVIDTVYCYQIKTSHFARLSWLFLGRNFDWMLFGVPKILLEWNAIVQRIIGAGNPRLCHVLNIWNSLSACISFAWGGISFNFFKCLPNTVRRQRCLTLSKACHVVKLRFSHSEQLASGLL